MMALGVTNNGSDRGSIRIQEITPDTPQNIYQPTRVVPKSTPLGKEDIKNRGWGWGVRNEGNLFIRVF